MLIDFVIGIRFEPVVEFDLMVALSLEIYFSRCQEMNDSE